MMTNLHPNAIISLSLVPFREGRGESYGLEQKVKSEINETDIKNCINAAVAEVGKLLNK